MPVLATVLKEDPADPRILILQINLCTYLQSFLYQEYPDSATPAPFPRSDYGRASPTACVVFVNPGLVPRSLRPIPVPSTPPHSFHRRSPPSFPRPSSGTRPHRLPPPPSGPPGVSAHLSGTVVTVFARSLPFSHHVPHQFAHSSSFPGS